MDTSDHGTKSDPNGTFELCPEKQIFSKKQSGSEMSNAPKNLTHSHSHSHSVQKF